MELTSNMSLILAVVFLFIILAMRFWNADGKVPALLVLIVGIVIVVILMEDSEKEMLMTTFVRFENWIR